MSEWWTYHLSDFLLFSARTYYRLVEIYNAAVWPVHIAAVGLGLAVLALLRLRAAERTRWIAAILAASWLWVAVAFHARRYATINWAATYFAWTFGVQAALLVWIGAIRGRLLFDRAIDFAGRIGVSIFIFALAVEPFVGPLLLGRPWRQVELFGVAPDATVVATLGLLLVAQARRRWPLMIVPVIWCAITGATLWAMKQPDAWIAPLAAAVVVSMAIRQGRVSHPTPAPSRH